MEYELGQLSSIALAIHYFTISFSISLMYGLGRELLTKDCCAKMIVPYIRRGPSSG